MGRDHNLCKSKSIVDVMLPTASWGRSRASESQWSSHGPLNQVDLQSSWAGYFEPQMSDQTQIVPLPTVQEWELGVWGPSLLWFLNHNHQARFGSYIWKRTALAWKTMVRKTEISLPSTYDEWLSTNIWWGTSFNTIGPCFSKFRATQLHKLEFSYIRDMWIHDEQSFLSGPEMHARFGLLDSEYNNWAAICRPLTLMGSRFFLQRSSRPASKDWIGLYRNPNDAIPVVMTMDAHVQEGRIDGTRQPLRLTPAVPCWNVQEVSQTLAQLPVEERHLDGYVKESL